MLALLWCECAYTYVGLLRSMYNMDARREQLIDVKVERHGFPTHIEPDSFELKCSASTLQCYWGVLSVDLRCLSTALSTKTGISKYKDRNFKVFRLQSDPTDKHVVKNPKPLICLYQLDLKVLDKHTYAYLVTENRQ